MCTQSLLNDKLKLTHLYNVVEDDCNFMDTSTSKPSIGCRVFLLILSTGEISYKPPDVSFMGRACSLLVKERTMMGTLEFTFLVMVKEYRHP